MRSCPDERRVDPGGRDGCRAPIPWEPDRPPRLAGGALAAVAPAGGRAKRGVGARGPAVDAPPLPRSAAARRASPALRRGMVRLHDAPEDVLAYERVCGEDRRLVLVNFGERAATCRSPSRGRWRWPALRNRTPDRCRRTGPRCSGRRSRTPGRDAPEHRVWRELSAGHHRMVRVADRKGRRRG